MSCLHLRESTAAGGSSRTTRQPDRGLFCTGTAGCRNGTTGSRERLQLKQVKEGAATAKPRDRTTLGHVGLRVPSEDSNRQHACAV